MNLESKIESILFVAGRPVSLKELAKAVDKENEAVEEALKNLQKKYENSGVSLLEQNNSYLLSTNPESAPLVKDFLNTDLREKLTDAAIETLAIVTYKQPVSRAEIEAIRGVNSQYTLRLLMMRGLIERSSSTKDGRQNVYKTTHEFLQHIGISSLKELPDFSELTKSVKPPEGFGESPVTNPPPQAS